MILRVKPTLILIIGITCKICSAAAELPVREVILYKNGAGYFERSGEVPAGESARLDFRADEMNDVLKSLTIRDASGKAVSGVRYDSAEPLDRKLSEYPFRLGAGQSISALFDQVKGAKVELATGSGTVKGIVTGSRALKGADGQDREQILILQEDGQVRSLDLAGVSGIKFGDPDLEQQLRDYLATLTASRSKEKKSIYFDSTGAGPRSLSVSYMAPAPAWKTSYRLLLESGTNAMLEGWAIIDNTTGEDWQNIRLALVSGRPVSFLTELYAPRYIARRTVESQDAAAAAPRRYEAAVAAGIAGGIQAPAPPPAARLKAGPVREMTTVAPSDVAGTAETREVGELFEYSFSTPVTVKKNESAMLPFVQQKLGARKLLIWTSGLHPMNAAELTNSTGKTLDAGPITVFDGGTYAGEALVDLVKQGDRRLIGYAVDQGTRVENRIDSGEETVQDVKLTRGVLTIRTAHRTTTTYTVRNIAASEKKLIIEHPLNPNAKIIGQQPAETTTTARRFELTLRPKADEKLTVVEEEILSSTEAVSDATPDTLITYQRSKSLSDAARQGLEQIAAAKSSLAATNEELRVTEKQIAELGQDQERARQNIRSLTSVPGQQDQVSRYANQLAATETRIAQLRDQQSALRKQQQAQQASLNALIEKLTF